MESKLSDKEIEFNLLMEMRPNVYGNTFVIGLLKLIAWFVAVGFLIMGIVLSTSGYFDEFIAPFSKAKPNNIDSIKFLIASSCYLLSVAFAFAVWVGRMLLRRNAFIMELDIWHRESQEKQNTKIK